MKTVVSTTLVTKVVATLAAMFIVVIQAAAGTFTWSGSGGWLSTARWTLVDGTDIDGDGYPGAGETGIVEVGTCQTTTTAFAGKLIIKPGGTLDVNNGGTANDLHFEGGTLKATTQGVKYLHGTVTFENGTTTKFTTTNPNGDGAIISATVLGDGDIEVDCIADRGTLTLGPNASAYAGTVDVKKGQLALQRGDTIVSIPDMTVNIHSGASLFVSHNNQNFFNIGKVNLADGSYLVRGSTDGTNKGSLETDMTVEGEVAFSFGYNKDAVRLYLDGKLSGDASAVITVGELAESAQDISQCELRLYGAANDFEGTYRLINQIALKTVNDGVLGADTVKLDLEAGTHISLASDAIVSSMILDGVELEDGTYDNSTHPDYFLSGSKSVTVKAIAPEGTLIIVR